MHQGEVNDAMNPMGPSNNNSSVSPSEFNPAHYTANDEYTFDAQSAITNYIQKHIRQNQQVGNVQGASCA